uniref:Uncharacterized protein n=1 Tax=Steinernema glaseri TaxID=37863 RepID=A0A1I7YEE1_9BILA
MTEVEETEPPVLIVLLRQQLTARRTGESEGSDYERSRERCEGARTCIIQCADGGNGEEGQRHSRGRRWCSEEGTTKQRTGSHAAGQTVLGGGQNALFVFAAFKTLASWNDGVRKVARTLGTGCGSRQEDSEGRCQS